MGNFRTIFQHQISTIFPLILVAVLVTGALAAPLDGADFEARVEAAVAAGDLEAADALLYRFHHAFEPERLPLDWRPETPTPLKCGTSLVQEFRSLRGELPAACLATIEAYLTPRADGRDTETYISPSGVFQMQYETDGPHAVPLEDVDPANGVPDFVEKVAGYFDISWDTEINQLGFSAPPLAPYYDVQFQEMNLYGYTDWTGGLGTRIIMHRDYLGFPPNMDPEGNRWGAAKVTAAHELKHASQLVASVWSEGEWTEVDAVWAEDLVFDQVNDYYNYFQLPNSVVHPQVPLDENGTGSYEDSIWQHWMSETYGNGIIVQYWQWRGQHIEQPVLESYVSMLLNNEPFSNFSRLWSTFCAWNYATGERAIPGIGYGEAAAYPAGEPTFTVSEFPATVGDEVAHLAANFVCCEDLAANDGWVTYSFNGMGSGLGLAAVVKKTDGTGLIELIGLDDHADASGRLSVPRQEIAAVGFIVANSSLGGYDQPWTMTLDSVLPDPALSLETTALELTLDSGGSATLPLTLVSSGEVGSELSYTIIPREALTGDKSIGGTTMSCNLGEFIPGTTTDLLLAVTNGSTDDEYLIDLWVDFPEGITVNSTGPFIGGEGGDMESDGTLGNGVQVAWHGDTGSPNFWGVVGNGQTARALVNVTFAEDLSGEVILEYKVDGDIWGGLPHSVTGTITLDQQQPDLKLQTPDDGAQLAIGQTVGVTWNRFGPAGLLTLELTRDGGDSWQTLFADLEDDGLEMWTISGPATSQAALRLSTQDGQASDMSSGLMTIYHPLNWAAASPASGGIPAGESRTVDLAIDATGLGVGVHEEELCVVTNDPLGEQVIPLRLTVEGAAGTMPGALVFELQGNHPNPFNPATVIAFSVPEAGPVAVDVLDVRGALVKRLWSGELEAGPHTVRWQGLDQQDRAVAAGTYLVRLRSQGRVATGKMVLAK